MDSGVCPPPHASPSRLPLGSRPAFLPPVGPELCPSALARLHKTAAVRARLLLTTRPRDPRSAPAGARGTKSLSPAARLLRTAQEPFQSPGGRRPLLCISEMHVECPVTGHASLPPGPGLSPSPLAALPCGRPAARRAWREVAHLIRAAHAARVPDGVRPLAGRWGHGATQATGSLPSQSSSPRAGDGG